LDGEYHNKSTKTIYISEVKRFIKRYFLHSNQNPLRKIFFNECIVVNLRWSSENAKTTLISIGLV
jgi:hypothetical protein